MGTAPVIAQCHAAAKADTDNDLSFTITMKSHSWFFVEVFVSLGFEVRSLLSEEFFDALFEDGKIFEFLKRFNTIYFIILGWLSFLLPKNDVMPGSLC